MSSSAVEEQLKAIIKPYIPEPELLLTVTEDSDFLKDLKINSAHMIDVILDVEEAFDIRIEDEQAEQLKTVGDALRLISSLKGE
ncbi:MAG: phosphopantetheine-binding protein [Bacteroidetes bacterium]|jgi:acyl carrier protein|nr:phosphopantetheine-binding protein [Bacteroidota bacterium]